MKFASWLQGSARQALALILLCAGSAYAQLPANVHTNSKQYNFATQIGSSAAAPPQTLHVISDQQRAFTVSTQLTNPTNPGVSWLLVNGATTTSGTTLQPSASVSVSVAPGTLPVGLYTGNIHVEIAGLPAATTDIVVFLRVSASPQIFIPNVPSVNMQGQTGANQISVLIPVSSTSTAVPYTATVSQYYGANGWLAVTPATGSTTALGNPQLNVTLTATLTSVPAGLHYAVINLRSGGAETGDVSLPVILNVAQTTTVSANPASLDFAFQVGNLSATTNNKVINITASPSGSLAYTATLTGDSRLSISKSASGAGATVLSGTTPENIYVIVNPVGVPAGGSVDGTVTIATSANSVSVPVRARVTTQPILVPSAESLNFNYSLGGTAPAQQTISLTSTSGQLNYQVSEAEVTGGDWLTITSPSERTPGNIAAAINSTRLLQLAAGTYTANITVASPTAFNNPLTIPVTLTVSGTAALLNVSTASGNNTLTFAAELNGAVPATQTVTVSSTDNSNQAFTLSLDPVAANSWLVLNPPSGGQTGTSGTLFTVAVLPSGVSTAGKYEADIVVTPQAAAGATPVPQKVHVTFNVSATATVTANPARVDVTQSGTTAPNPVTIQLQSAVQGIQFIARSNQSWVTVSPTGGTLPTSITLTFNSTGVVGGANEAVITVAPTGANEVRIPVTLTLAQGAINLSQSTFTVNYSQGSPAPAPLTVGLTSTGAALPFAAAATSTGNWLSVTPLTGTTTASTGAATNLTITANPAGLAPGNYTGTVRVTSASASNSPQNVTVNLVVSAAAVPAIQSVNNGATNQLTLVAPGLIVAIKGSNLGPSAAEGVLGKVVNGSLETTVGETRVLFDGVPAPILYAQANQVNAVVPYGVFGRTSTRVVVEYRGVRSEPLEYRVVDSAPGIITANATGQGPAQLLNQNFTINSQTNPARRGEFIYLYATGEGMVAPVPADGRITTGPVESLARPVLPVSVRINGQAVPPQNITYAGAAPTFVAGALQVNVQIPADLNIGALMAVPIELVVGTAASRAGVTVFVMP